MDITMGNKYFASSPDNASVVEFIATEFEFMEDKIIVARCNEKVIRAVIPFGWAIVLVPDDSIIVE